MSQEGQQEPQAAEQASARVEETRWQRGLRYGHRTTLYLALGLGLAVLIYLILLIARNTTRVKIDYVFGSAASRVIWLIIISAITGWVLGIVTAFLVRRRTRWRRMT